jgi:hypothetical protein
MISVALVLPAGAAAPWYLNHARAKPAITGQARQESHVCPVATYN